MRFLPISFARNSMTLRGLRRALGQLDAGVDVLGVLAEDHDVHQLRVLDGRRRALEVAHRPHAGVQIEHLAQRHVQAADAAAHRRRQRPLDGDLVLLDRFERVVRAATRRSAPCAFSPASTSNQTRRRLPPYAFGDRGIEHAHAGAPDVGAGAVAFDEGNDRIVGNDELAVLDVMAVPSVGGLRCVKFGIRIRTLPRRELGHVPPRRYAACTDSVENPVEKPVAARREPASNRCDSCGLHHRGASERKRLRSRRGRLLQNSQSIL